MNLGLKTGEISANRKYILGRMCGYLVVAVIIAISGATFKLNWQQMFSDESLGAIKDYASFIPYLLALIFVFVAVLPLSRLGKKVDLFEQGFTYGRRSFTWDSIHSITWLKKPYYLLGFIPIPFITYYKVSAIPMDNSPILPELSSLYLDDLHYKLFMSFENAKKNKFTGAL